MDEIKEAFNKVKKDIEYLKLENRIISKNFQESKQKIIELCDIISNLFSKIKNLENSNKTLADLILEKEKSIISLKKKKTLKNLNYKIPILNKSNNLNDTIESNTLYPKNLFKNNFQENICLINKHSNIQTDTQTDTQTNILTQKEQINTEKNYPSTQDINIKARKAQNQSISIGNEGVKTDRQTHRQTHRQTENSFDSALNALNSLDNLKKEIRLKFKKLTTKELLVFSTIYQLEEEYGYSDYKSLSKKLNLSESSIRDYVSRLILKEIPIIKSKINNKEINLSISSSLKKITSLNTILQLIEI